MLRNVQQACSVIGFDLDFTCLLSLKIVLREGFGSSFEFKLFLYHHLNFEGKMCFKVDLIELLAEQELKDFAEAIVLDVKS